MATEKIMSQSFAFIFPDDIDLKGVSEIRKELGSGL
jgi:hypothetical protein